MKILLLEDDENDVLFVKHAAERSQDGHSVQAVHNGAEAICYLLGEGKYSDRDEFPFPSVILSDLKGQNRVKAYWRRTNRRAAVILTEIKNRRITGVVIAALRRARPAPDGGFLACVAGGLGPGTAG